MLIASVTETGVYSELRRYKCAYRHAELRSLFLSKLMYHLIILDILVPQFKFRKSTISLAVVMYVLFFLNIQ